MSKRTIITVSILSLMFLSAILYAEDQRKLMDQTKPGRVELRDMNLDSSGDAKFSDEEIHQWVELAKIFYTKHYQASKKSLKEDLWLIPYYDKNNNGQLEWDEGERLKTHVKMLCLYHTKEVMIKNFDRNNDGKLSSIEMRQVRSAYKVAVPGYATSTGNGLEDPFTPRGKKSERKLDEIYR